MGTTTTNLELYKPDVGEDGWGLLVNANWDVIDALELTGGGLTDVTVLGTPNVAVTSHTTQNTTLLTNTARTAASTTVPFTNEFWKGLQLIIDVTAGTTVTSLQPTLQVQDPITTTWITFWSGTAITAATVTRYIYILYPGATGTPSGNITEYANISLPRTCRLNMTFTGTSCTYSAAACFLL